MPLKPGQTVVLQGTGGVSIFAAQIAVAAGVRVIMTSSSDEKLGIAQSLGVHVRRPLFTPSTVMLTNAKTSSTKTTPDWEQRVLQLTDGRGAELVIDVGGADTLSKSRQAIKLGGQVVVIGVLSGGDSPPDLLRKVMFRNAIVRGITVGDVVLFKELCASSSCTRSSRSSARFSSSRPRRRRMRAWRSRTS